MSILVKCLIQFYLLYLWKHFSKGNTQYLKLILRKKCFDHLMSIFTLGVMVFSYKVKMCVNFFLIKKSYKMRFWENHFITLFIISPKVFELQRCKYPKLILLSYCFAPLKCIFAIGVVIFAPEIKICVHFFMGHSLLGLQP